MKALKIFIIFVAALFVADRGIAFVMNKIYDLSMIGQTGGKINYYLKKKQLPDVLIMGDSRAFYLVNPDSFKTVTAFNIAHAGMDQCFQNGLFSVLLHKKKLPKKILLHIEPNFYLTNSDGKKFVSTDIQQLKYYYGEDELVTKYINELGTFEWMKYLFHSYKYNGRLVNTLINSYATRKTPKATGNGYESNGVTKLDSLHTEYSAEHSKLKKYPLNRSTTRYIEEFLKMATANSIEVSCFTSPTYYKMAISNYAPAQQYLDSLFAANKIKYIDYERHNPADTRYRDAHYWKDADHLNGNGAKFFSAQIEKDFFTTTTSTEK